MKHRLSYLFLILPVGVTLFSCVQEEYCGQSVESKANIGFYSGHNEEKVDTSFYQFWVRGYQQDSLINSDTLSVSDISLPLSNSVDSCKFILSYRIIIRTDTTHTIFDTIYSLGTIPDSLSIIAKDSLYFASLLSSLPDTIASNIQFITEELTDTLCIYYTRELNYVSPACGFMYNYVLKNFTFTRNGIDEVVITNPYVSTLDEENIQILY